MGAATIKRPDFIRRFVEFGLTYQQADKAYRAMMAVLEDGIGSKSKVIFFGVGTLTPYQQKPRRYRMGFLRDKDGCRRVKRDFIIGSRTRYKFKIHDAFGRAHNFYV